MKIIISDNDHEDINQETAVFDAAGMPFTLLQCKTEDDLIRQCKGAEIILNQYAPFTRRVLTALHPELKQIIRYGVGVNNVDCEAATELGVQVCNVPDYGMNEVADHAISLMLALVRKIPMMNQYTKHETWDYTHAIPIHRIPGQTVGIIGMGRIGKTFAKRISGFDCRVLGVDEAYELGTNVAGADIVTLDTVLSEADMISIHCPLNENTRNLFNLESFKKMKSTAYLVNTARGGIVNERDLCTALKEGLLGGAAMDVVEKEPMSGESELFKLDNYLATPHIAWYSEESAVELNRKIAEEAVRFARGEPLWYPMNTL